MKKIKSIYFIFVFFFVMIMASFAVLYSYSRISIQNSLQNVAQIQMKYASSLLDQKCREIEIEADGILNSDSMRAMQGTMEMPYNVWRYVTSARDITEYLRQRQVSNVGMREFILYWPDRGRLLSTSFISGTEDAFLQEADDNKWFCYKDNIYYVKRYEISKGDTSANPYLFVKLDRDYLYRIKSMASGMEYGGTVLLVGGDQSIFPTSVDDDRSIFPTTDVEKELLKAMKERPEDDDSYIKTSEGKYAIVSAEISRGDLQMVSYYAVSEMMRPVGNINRITMTMLLVFLLTGMVYMFLYYREILMQLKTLTDKLRQVEDGDFSTQIEETSGNEFSYVFTQFNRMVLRIGQLMDSTLKEQKLRSKAEQRQLQMQIQPHFLYNSLAYIVSVADQPEAVTEMAMHLSDYYRHCTKSKSMTTIGEEVSYAKAYLGIMALRKRIEYSISADRELYEVPILPLILQPIIENAIEHAIEERENARHIYVKIYRLPTRQIRFEVSDDGNGLTQEEIEKLMERLHKKQDESESVGLWNVNQRLLNYYGETAQLEFSKSIWSGLMVAFTIQINEE